MTAYARVDLSGGSVVKSPRAMQEAGIWSPGRDDLLEEERATHSSSCLGEKWTEEPGGLLSMGSKEWDMS